MSFTRTLSPILALVLSACVVPPGPPPPPFQGMAQPLAVAPLPAPGLPVNTGADPRDEYRTGYDIGGRDASYGYPSDPRRAYARFGHGIENAFQEGYADGFSRRPARY